MDAAGELLRADDPALRGTNELAPLRALLAGYAPRDAHQASERARMQAFLEAHVDCLERTCLEGHFTGSALVVDADRGRALLTHHRKLERWLQLGGHCDGDGNLPAVALREAIEESGIADLAVDPRPLDLDVHAIPARPAKGERPAEPEHLHLDVRFLVVAPPGAIEVVSGESLELAWFAPAGLERVQADASVRRLFDLVFR